MSRCGAPVNIPIPQKKALVGTIGLTVLGQKRIFGCGGQARQRPQSVGIISMFAAVTAAFKNRHVLANPSKLHLPITKVVSPPCSHFGATYNITPMPQSGRRPQYHSLSIFPCRYGLENGRFTHVSDCEIDLKQTLDSGNFSMLPAPKILEASQAGVSTVCRMFLRPRLACSDRVSWPLLANA